MGEILVSDLMTRDIITIPPEMNLLDCAKQMVRKRVRSLPIINQKRLVGFISQEDILWALIKESKNDLSKVKAIEISPKKIAAVKPSSTIREVIQKMKNLKFDRFPVILNGELVGIITAKDILNFNPEFYPELEEFRHIREESIKFKRIKNATNRKIVSEGICEECGNHGALERVDGMMVCGSCSNL